MSQVFENGRTKTAEDGINPKLIVGGVLVVLALIFIFQNTGSKTVSFLWLDITMPAWIWMLVLFVVGVAVGSVFPWFRRRNKP